MRFFSRIFSCSLLILFSFSLVAQDKKSLDATKIAGDYYNSIVKILLVDSVKEKLVTGSGFLGRGSGFLVTEDGYIFTNKHVIDYCLNFMRYTYYDPSDKKKHDDNDVYFPSALKDPEFLNISYVGRATPIIQVYTDKFGNYKLYVAKVVAVDTANFDGAILKIVSDMNGNPVTESFHPAPMGNSDSIKQGEDLCVYGFPSQYDAGFNIMLKDQSTLTFGKHSGYDFVYNADYGFIKTDAAINGGNSGGPVFDASNRVIGLASKTIDKTNTGLIGGINAMYHLAALKPELLEKLVKNGLEAPAKKLPVNTALLTSTTTLPTKKQIKGSNALKKTIRSSKGGTWYIKGSYAINQEERFQITPSTSKAYITNRLNPLNVKAIDSKGIEMGRLFTLWRIAQKQKLSLDWTFLNYTSSTFDWSNANIYQDTSASIITKYYPRVSYSRYGTRIGINYSQIFLKRFVADLFYKASICLSEESKIGNTHYPDRPPVTVYDQNHDSVYSYPVDNFPDRPITISSYGFLMHSFGFNVRFKLVMIGMEYSFADIQDTYSFSIHAGNDLVQVYPIGNRKSSSVNLTCGLFLNGNKKWKKLLNREYRHSIK